MSRKPPVRPKSSSSVSKTFDDASDSTVPAVPSKSGKLALKGKAMPFHNTSASVAVVANAGPSVPDKPKKRPKGLASSSTSKAEKPTAAKKPPAVQPVSIASSNGPAVTSTITDELAALRKDNDKLRDELERTRAALIKERAYKAEQDQSSETVLRIIAETKLAKEKQARVAELKGLLSLLAEVQAFEREAPSVVMNETCNAKLRAISEQYQRVMHWGDARAAAPASASDYEALTKNCLAAVDGAMNDLARLADLEQSDHGKLDGLIGRLRDTVRRVTDDPNVPSETPPFSLTQIVDEFNQWKATFESTYSVIERIASKIRDLEAEKAESARVAVYVSQADEQRKMLFSNTKWYILDKSRHAVDPEIGAQRVFYKCIQQDLAEQAERRRLAAEIEKSREQLQVEMRTARKAHRQKKRELEDGQDDGDLSPKQEQDLIDEVKQLRLALNVIERKDEELQLKAKNLLSGPSTVDRAPLATDRSLANDYDYEPLRDGQLKAKLKGEIRWSVLKIYQKPASSEALKEQIDRINLLHHPSVDNVSAAFCDGPHFYVEVPLYAHADLNSWVKAVSPSFAAINTVLRNVLTGIAFLHSHNLPHGRICPQAVVVGDDQVAHLSDFWKPSASLHSDLYRAPELAAGEHMLTPASDLFSFALVAIETKTGQPPHRKSLTESVSVPSLDEKNLATSLRPMLSMDPLKRPLASKVLLLYPYFGDVSDAEGRAMIPSMIAARKRLSDGRTGLRAALDEKIVRRLRDSIQSHDVDQIVLDNDYFESRDGGKHLLPNPLQDDMLGYEALGRKLLLNVIEGTMSPYPFAPVLLKYIVGVLPSGIRDLLHDLMLFDPAHAEELRRIRLCSDLNSLQLVMPDSKQKVTNAERSDYLRAIATHELITSRHRALDAIRQGFLWKTGPPSVEPAVREVLRQLRASDLGCLFSGEGFVDGALVVSHLSFVGDTDALGAKSLRKVLESMHSDDLRRFLFSVTGGLATTPAMSKNPVIAKVLVSEHLKAAEVHQVFSQLNIPSSADRYAIEAIIEELSVKLDASLPESITH